MDNVVCPSLPPSVTTTTTTATAYLWVNTEYRSVGSASHVTRLRILRQKKSLERVESEREGISGIAIRYRYRLEVWSCAMDEVIQSYIHIYTYTSSVPSSLGAL